MSVVGTKPDQCRQSHILEDAKEDPRIANSDPSMATPRCHSLPMMFREMTSLAGCRPAAGGRRASSFPHGPPGLGSMRTHRRRQQRRAVVANLAAKVKSLLGDSKMQATTTATSTTVPTCAPTQSLGDSAAMMKGREVGDPTCSEFIIMARRVRSRLPPRCEPTPPMLALCDATSTCTSTSTISSPSTCEVGDATCMEFYNIAKQVRMRLPPHCEPKRHNLALCNYSYSHWAYHDILFGKLVEDLIYDAHVHYGIGDDEKFMEHVLDNLPDRLTNDPAFLPNEEELEKFQSYVITRRMAWLSVSNTWLQAR